MFLLFVVAIIFIAVIVGHIFGLQCASLSSLFTLHFLLLYFLGLIPCHWPEVQIENREFNGVSEAEKLGSASRSTVFPLLLVDLFCYYCICQIVVVVYIAFSCFLSICQFVLIWFPFLIALNRRLFPARKLRYFFGRRSSLYEFVDAHIAIAILMS